MEIRKVRCSSIVLGFCNVLVFVLGGFLILHTFRLCDRRLLLPFVAVSIAALIRIVVMFQTAFAQDAAAKLILDDTSDLLLRLNRRVCCVV